MSVSYFKTAAQSAFTGVAVTVGPIEWIMPFEGRNDRVLFRQRFQQDIASWTALSLNTAHPVSTTYLLVAENDFAAIGGGQHQWARYFACTPPDQTEYSTEAFTFPGLFAQRDPIAATVPVKLTTSFHLLGTVPTLAQASTVTFTNGAQQPLLSDVFLNDGGGTLSLSSPTRSAYLALITTDATAANFSITAAPQTLERWQGNFYARRTVKAKAV